MTLKKLIEEVKTVKRPYNLSPQQNRYVDKQVRNELGLFLPKIPKRLPDFLNPAEIYHLSKLAYERDNEYGVLVDFQIYTGCRISETRNMMIQNIDFYNNELKVVQGKGHKDRYVPITLNLGKILRQFVGDRKTGYLFSKKNNLAYSVRALQHRIESLLKECAFSNKKLSTHSLRHTFACLCLSRGMSLEQIKLLMGHSNIKTTEIYAKLELSSIKDDFLRLM